MFVAIVTTPPCFGGAAAGFGAASRRTIEYVFDLISNWMIFFRSAWLRTIVSLPYSIRWRSPLRYVALSVMWSSEMYLALIFVSATPAPAAHESKATARKMLLALIPILLRTR